MAKAMDTQNMGNRWVKLTVPSRGSTIQVGRSSTMYVRDSPAEYDSSPRKLCMSDVRMVMGHVEDSPMVGILFEDRGTDEVLDIYHI